MRFKGLDLNLLGAFDVLLRTRSVSAAARQMNLSQPAMSAALARLRDHFSDPILVSEGRRMHPTAFARALEPQVRACLREVEGVLAVSSTFDPATSQRRFRLITSDYIIAAVIAPLGARLAVEAPQVRLELTLPSETNAALINDGRVDLLVTPEAFALPDHPAELLFEERHVVLGAEDNAYFGGKRDAAALADAGFVGIRIGDQRGATFADRELDRIGFARRVEIETASFTTVPWLLVGTERLAILHERLALRLAKAFPLAIAPLPFAFPAMREVMQYHRSHAGDEGLAWLRAQLQVAATIDGMDRFP